jgi:hypothetical protein
MFCPDCAILPVQQSGQRMVIRVQRHGETENILDDDGH